MEHHSIVGLDIAKNVFQVHRTYGSGQLFERKQLRRAGLVAYFAALPPSLVALEACASAHYWARSLVALGHEVRLIAPVHVKPYVGRQKNDAADAAGLAEAVTRPGMRFVPIKGEAQQSALMLHRVRELLLKQQTMLINALRGHLAELGLVSAKGREGAARLMALVEGEAGRREVNDLARRALLPLVDQIRALRREINQRMREMDR